MTHRVVFQCMECMEGFGTLMDVLKHQGHPRRLRGGLASFKGVFVSEHLSFVSYHHADFSYPWHLFHTQMSFCATFSYHFGIIKNVWYATCLAQYRHSFFSYPWYLFHTQMTLFHTWCKIFIPIWYTNKKTP